MLISLAIAIEVSEDSVPYSVAGQNVTLYLSAIDPIHLAIGTVLCPTHLPVAIVSVFTAQILVFDLSSPIITGTAVSISLHMSGEVNGMTRIFVDSLYFA